MGYHWSPRQRRYFSSESSNESIISIDEIETTFMQPMGKETQQYLRESLASSDVQAFFEGSRWRKCVYMIVGLKIAKSAKFSMEK